MYFHLITFIFINNPTFSFIFVYVLNVYVLNVYVLLFVLFIQFLEYNLECVYFSLVINFT